MPAHRSRTERWRDCLQQIYERSGGIEISLKPSVPPVPTASQPQQDLSPPIIPDLMWRVRVSGLAETELLIERPAAAGTSIAISPGTPLVAVMSVGQNRWMFHSVVLGPADGRSPFGGSDHNMLRLRMPDKVERCHRRDFLRISTAELILPKVCCWPLFNPAATAAAESANRGLLHDVESGRRQAPDYLDPNDLYLPEVGPSFAACLMNVGGGGVGLLFSKEDASAADRARYIWMRMDLSPVVAAPIAMCARIVHKHLDSEQNLIAGASFEFNAGNGHREFVVEQMLRYVNTWAGKAKAA